MDSLDAYKVIVFTSAYNVENIVGRTIESVLNQTHQNFEYYIFDNASTDGTWDVILKYAQKDKRIIPERFDFNTFGRAYEFICNIDDYSEKRYFVILDSDDEYVPCAFDRLLKTMLETGAHIVGSNSFFIDEITGEARDTFTAGDNLLIEGEGFGLLFPQYHKYLRTVWGKMYDLYSLFVPVVDGPQHGPHFEERGVWYIPPALSNSFTVSMFLYSKKVYILKDRLYRYYIRHNSVSRQYYNKRFESILRSYNTNIGFIDSKIGYLSVENKNFVLYEVFKEIRVTLPILFSSQITLSMKLKDLIEIFSNSVVCEIYQDENFIGVEKRSLLSSVYEWLSTQITEAGSEESGLAAELEAYLSTLGQTDKSQRKG